MRDLARRELRSSLALLLVLDDVDAHLRKGRHHVLDLLGGHLVLRQRFVQFVDGDRAALFGARDQLLHRSIVEIDEGGVAAVLIVRVLGFDFGHGCGVA